MDYLLPTFKFVSMTFAIINIFTNTQSLLDPIAFSRGFGLPIAAVKDASSPKPYANPTTTYVSLMGARQLATAITLLVFAYQGKWTEMATILSIMGVVVAGTDGFYLYRAGERSKGKLHAIPGALIATLAGAVVFMDA